MTRFSLDLKPRAIKGLICTYFLIICISSIFKVTNPVLNLLHLP